MREERESLSFVSSATVLARILSRMARASEVAERMPEPGHVYACCGKTGRISRHQSWCPVAQVGTT
jgi:hypothetical protein